MTAPKYDSSNGRLSFYICGRPVTVYASGRDGESYENAYKQASMPKSELKMDWVYGYQGKTNGRFNLHKLVTNEVIYYMAGVAVIYDHKLYNQRFYVEHTDDISAISVHPDKKTIATAQVSGHGKRKCDRTHIRIWDSIKLETLVVINSDDFKGPIVALDFSRHDNGQHIACIEKSSKSYYHVFNTIKTNVTRVCSMQSSGKSPMCIACSPMGPYVAICGKRQLEYINICYENFNYVKHKALAEADYTKGSEKIDCFTSLIYTQNGTLLCTDSRGSLLIFHHTLNNDKLGLSLKTHVQVSSSPLLSIALKDDCAYVGGKERMVTKILLQDIDNLQFEHLGDLNETYGSIRTILPMDDYYLVGTTINALICFESKENQHIVSKAASDEAWALSIDEEHKAILGSNGKELVKIDLKKKKVLNIKLIKVTIMSCYMSTNGNIYIGSKCGTLEIYNKEELICLYSKKISKEYLSCITMTEDKKYLGVGGGDNYIYIFNVFESEELLSLYHVFKGHSSFVKHIDFTRNGNFMRSNSASNDLLFWNIKTKQQEVNRSQYSNEKWATKYCTIEFNVSGIWKEGIDGSDINTCDVIKCQESNESLLATGDDFGNVILYKYPYIRKNFNQVAYPGHSSHITKVRFSKDGKNLLSLGGNDCSLIQWKIKVKET